MPMNREFENYIIEFSDTDSEQKSKKKKRVKPGKFSIFDFSESVIYALITIAVIFVLFFRVMSVKGTSMVPTLHDGEKIVVTSVGYKPVSGDVVVVSGIKSFDEPLVKRIIAVGGDKVDINFSTGKVYVNNMELTEYYINEPTNRQYNIAFPLTVPEGCIFILGDNRNDSLDSRSSLIGCVDERCIVGHVVGRVQLGNWSVE